MSSRPSTLRESIVAPVRKLAEGVRLAWVRRAAQRMTQLFVAQCHAQLMLSFDASRKLWRIEQLSLKWRARIRIAAGLPEAPSLALEDLLQEAKYLIDNQHHLRPAFELLRAKRVLYPGQAYYNSWYLSRALRDFGWKADLLNWDTNPSTQIYYHGQDFRVGEEGLSTPEECLAFYLSAIYAYDVFHFSNNQGINFGSAVQGLFHENFDWRAEIYLLKSLGKKIVYSNNGCLDGVSQTAFSKWGSVSVCSICPWRNVPIVCSDERNLAWGRFRNSVADYQCLLGGNRIDYNDDPTVHEVPEFYCLEPSVWHPELEIPPAFRLPALPDGTVRLYHAVGHRKERTSEEGINIKSTHIYLPLVQKLQAEGLLLELIEPTGIPNLDIRYFQLQADIFLEMLTFGWFGANAREAMMLGKPVICYIRPEWLESLRAELPEYADELPIVSATPETVESVLRELIANPAMRREIGDKSRAFALKWHSTDAAARKFEDIYGNLLNLRPSPLATMLSSALA
jgi:hypothetical protein